jgi:hypothetical protein
VFFMNENSDGGRCVDCHAMPAGTNRIMIPDQALLHDQDMKVPQLRNLYPKTGFTNAAGPSKRASGFTHDGTNDNLFTFLQFPLFNFGPPPDADNNRRDVEAFLHAFDTGTAAAVGFQVTFDGTSNPLGVSQVDTLKDVWTTNRIDIVAKGKLLGQSRGWVYVGGDLWDPDKVAEGNVSTSQLIGLATSPGTALTITAVPDGSGERIGIDRDRDTYPDGDELDAGSAPDDPSSIPPNVGVAAGAGGMRVGLDAVMPNPASGPAEIVFSLSRPGKVDIEVYDLLGRVARVVARDAWFAAGRRNVIWDGRRGDGRAAGTGVYFVRLRAEGGTWTRPVLMRR